MFKKRLVRLLMVLLVINIFMVSSAYGVEVKKEKVEVSNIIIKANVPSDFDKNIMINFNFEDGTNALYTLSKESGYVYKGLIEIGKANLNFANVTPDDGAYKVQVNNKELNVTANENINIEVNVSKVKGYKEEKREFTYDNKPITDYGNKKDDNNIVNTESNINNKAQEQKDNKAQEQKDNKAQEQKDNKDQEQKDNKDQEQKDNKDQGQKKEDTEQRDSKVKEQNNSKAQEQSKDETKEKNDNENWIVKTVKENALTIIIVSILLIVIAVLKIKLG